MKQTRIIAGRPVSTEDTDPRLGYAPPLRYRLAALSDGPLIASLLALFVSWTLAAVAFGFWIAT